MTDAKVHYMHRDPTGELGPPVISTTVSRARRLVITNQHLAGGPRQKDTGAAILSVVRELGCVQLDPINAVAPSHLIVLWSRIGNFRQSELDKQLWEKRSLFEYWAHQSSIVATEDYPLYYSLMKAYPDSFPKPWGPLGRLESGDGCHKRLS